MWPDLNVTGLRYLDKEKPGFWHKSKKSSFDVLCETRSSEKVIVEMQVLKQDYFRDRTPSAS